MKQEVIIMAIYQTDFAIPINITEESPFERIMEVSKGDIRHIAIRLPKTNEVGIQFVVDNEVVLPKRGWACAQGWKHLFPDQDIKLSEKPLQIHIRAINPDSDTKVCIVVIGDSTETRETFEEYLSHQPYYS
jgi:hypothetical protein